MSELSAAPPVEEFEAITCPLQRAVRLTDLAKGLRTLPSAHASLRSRSLLTVLRQMRRADGSPYTLKAVASEVGMSFGRVGQLVRAVDPRRTRDSASPAVPPGDVANKTAAGGAIQTVTAGGVA